MKKKISLAAFGLACTFLAIVLSLYFYSKTEHAKKLLVDKINTAIPGTLSAENIELSFINPSVKLDGIMIKDKQNKSCLRFRSLLLNFKIRPLFQKVLEISSFTVNNPEISLVMDINGHMNLINALIPKDKELSGKGIVKKESKGISFNVIVKKAQIIEGILTFNDPEKQIKLKSFNVEVTGVDLFERHLSLASRIKDSRIKLKDQEILIKNLSLFSELKQGSKLDFDIELDSDLCAFKAKGKAYDIITAPGIDFNLTASSPLEALNRFLGHEMDLGGLAKVTLEGKGPLNNPEVAFNLDVANPKIDGNLKGDGINLSAALADRILLIKKGRLNILGSDIALKGEADLKDFFPKGFLNPPQNPDTLKYDFSFDQKNGDFQHLEKWVKGFSGRFSSSGRIRGKGLHPETLAADYDFNLVLEKFKQDKPETDFLDFETDISGTIEKGICRIKGFKAETPGAVVGARGQYDMVKKRLGASLDVKTSDLSLITLALGLPEVKGSVDGNISIAGDIFSPELKAIVTGKNFMTQGVSIHDFQFAGSMDPLGQVTIQQLTAKDQDLVIDVEGTADVFETAFKLKDNVKATLSVSGRNVTPVRLIKPDTLKVDQNILNALINFHLNMDLGYAMGASMNGINFSDKELPIKNILADLDFQKKEIVIALKKIATLKASLDTKKNQYHARIDFSHSDLVPLLESAGINGIQASIDGQMSATGTIPDAVPKEVIKELNAAHGRISLKAETRGSFKKPDVTVQADFYDLAYRLNKQGISISNLNSSLAATRKTIQINAMTANINDGRFSLTGRLDLKDNKIQDGKLAVSIVGIDIPIPSKTGAKQSIFMEKLDSNLDINLKYDAMASQGAADRRKTEIPIKTIRATLDLNKPAAVVLLDKTTDLRASFDPDTASFDLDLKFDRLLLEPLFKLAGLDNIKGSINGDTVSKGKLNLVLPSEVMDGVKHTSGKISCIMDIKGTVDNPDVHFKADFYNLNYQLNKQGISISNLNSSLTGSRKTIQINAMTANINDGRFSLKGRLNLKDDKIQDGKLAVSAVGIDIPIPSKTDGKESIFMEKLDSNLDLHLQYDARTHQGSANRLKNEIPIKTIRADLDLKKLSVAVLLDKTTDLRASFDPDTAFFDLDLKFDRLLLEPLFKLAGLDNIKGSINGNAVSNGKLNLVLPPEAMDAVKQTSGKVSCSADIMGSFEQPDINAVVTLSEIKYPIPRAGVSISNLNGKIKLLKDELAIENIVADLDKGRVNINGKIGLRDYMPVKGDVRFTGDHIALELPDMAQIEFSHDFTFSGTREKSNLSGTFQMIKGEYYKDFTFDLTDALDHKERETSASGEKNNTGIPLIENTVLNIDVDYNDPFVVDNNLVFILVEPNINISGTTVNPIITGRAKIVEGTLIYQKKEFQIEQGIIDFVDPYKIDPDINLAAKAEIRDWIIKLKVSGKKDNLKFQLFSEPSETHEDILSLLITGKTTKELGKGGGGSYTNILTDKAANVIGETVKESTPLDSFKIGYDNSGSQSSNLSVTMGKKLSKRMEVTYSMKTLDEETVHTNAAEYKILENVILKAFNDSKGDFGTEVTYKLEFR